MLQAGTIILILKVAVAAVTVLLAVSLAALCRGNYRLHGRINMVFFVLTVGAVLGLEAIVNVIAPGMIEEHLRGHQAESALRTHLWFSVPSAALLLVMLPTGWRHYRRIHVGLGVIFLGLWAGTFVTGLFFLPHGAIP